VINRREQKEKGQALVEFAVILPVLLMVLWGIFQFGIAFNDYIQVTSAAREGARKAAVSRSLGSGAATSAAISAAQAVAPDLHLSASQITVTPANNWQAGTDVTVTVKYPYKINIIGRIVGSGNLTSSTTMRIE
jgi:Flp pilus assembly protein TadG